MKRPFFLNWLTRTKKTDTKTNNEEPSNTDKGDKVICPACKEPKGEFLLGPSGGCSQNIKCNTEGCGAEWNHSPFGLAPINNVAENAFNKRLIVGN
jgi:hypothetical protein